MGGADCNLFNKLLVHGTDDRNGPPKQSEACFWHAKGSGKQVAGDMWAEDPHLLSLYSRVVLPLNFFEGLLAGTGPPWLTFDMLMPPALMACKAS